MKEQKQKNEKWKLKTSAANMSMTLQSVCVYYSDVRFVGRCNSFCVNHLLFTPLNSAQETDNTKPEHENDLKVSSLSPMILQQMYIEKWDGKLPVYGTVPQICHDITKK